MKKQLEKHWQNTGEYCPECGTLESNCAACTEYFKKRKAERTKSNEIEDQK